MVNQNKTPVVLSLGFIFGVGLEITEYQNHKLGYFLIVLTALLAAWQYRHFLFSYRDRLIKFVSGYVYPEFDTSLYVGRMDVNDTRLDQDLCLEITVQGFNGSGRTISVNEISGYIHMTPDDTKKTFQLPQPTLDRTRTRTTDIPPSTEIFFLLEQRIPGELAKQVSACLANGGLCQLDFDKFDIKIEDIRKPKMNVRLPIFDGVRITRYPDRLHTGRVIKGSVHMRLGLKDNDKAA